MMESLDDVYFKYDIKNNLLYIIEVFSSISKQYKLEDYIGKFIYDKDKGKFYNSLVSFKKTEIKFRMITNDDVCWFKLIISNCQNEICWGSFKNINREIELEAENEILRIMNIIQNYMLKVPNQMEKSNDFFNNLANFFEADQIFVALNTPDLEIKYSSDLKNSFTINQKQLRILEEKYLEKSGLVHRNNNIPEIPEIKSLIDFPLYDQNNQNMGFLCVVNIKKEIIPENMLDFLSTSISNVIQIIIHHEELEKQGVYDLLTEVKNRNAYEEYLKNARINNLKNLGIIVVDINGLKSCNDTSGHRAGDKLIQNVAATLSQFFNSHNFIVTGEMNLLSFVKILKKLILKRELIYFKLIYKMLRFH